MAKDPAVGPVTRYLADGGSMIAAEPDTEAGELFQNARILPEPFPVVILAGGKGTRLQAETKGLIPKPLVTVGGITLLDHIIQIYMAQGMREFFVAYGIHKNEFREWYGVKRQEYLEIGIKVWAYPTGEITKTGGRLLRIADKLDGRDFMMTYGDGFADINLLALVDHFERMDAPVALTAAHPPARFGNLNILGGMAEEFGEKSQVAVDWINAGFYIIKNEILKLIPGDACRFEYDILPALALQGRLAAYQHPGFFQMVDTPRELNMLQQMWETGNTPWIL